MSDLNKLRDVPATPGTGAGFSDVAHDIRGEAEALGELSGDRVLTLAERHQVYRVASQGVLEVLGRAGVEEAGTLLEALVIEARTNGMADLRSVSDAYYNQSLDIEDDATRREKEELSRLARVSGDAARAAVAVSLSATGNVLPVLRSARKEVMGYDNLEVSLAGNALHAFLDEAEAAVPTAPTPASPEQPSLAA